MARETFILMQTKNFRHTINVFLKSTDGKTDKRSCVFTTEHKVNEQERTGNARKIPAEFSTNNPDLIEGLYRDTGYGKTFVHKDDPKGERKKTPFTKFNVDPKDARKVALKNMFEIHGLEFDSDKAVEVLEQELSIHVSLTKGINAAQSTAKEVPHVPVNVEQQLLDKSNEAISIYAERYGEELPDKFKNDKALLSALLDDPEFDAKGYIASKGGDEPQEELPDSIEELQALYLQLKGTNPAPAYKNNPDWLKAKIKEHN